MCGRPAPKDADLAGMMWRALGMDAGAIAFSDAQTRINFFVQRPSDCYV